EALASARQVEPVNALAVFGRVESRGYYQLRFLAPDDIVDAGTRRVYISGRDGAVLGRIDELRGTAADFFRIWQFPLHSGQGFGLPGRIVICAAGLLPLLFAFTGVWLWRRRVKSRRDTANVPGPPTSPAARRAS
ncbi:MAG TPA: PepSY-associated TM helix domain-containing protein, partial [Vicinamibacterales bacterium]|nr:PepSY-associated TM helix domain-containing protein [Vicinamibacterales bacterium]